FLTAIGTVKFRQIKAGMAMAASFQPPPEAVTTIAAAQAAWPATLQAIGTVEAVRGVTVSADLPGVVEQIAFESGRTVREGEVLVRTEGLASDAGGRITALDSVVNEGTRYAQGQATLANPGGRLRPGTFVKAEVVLGTEQVVVVLPASVISYAPYGDSVFVVG